MSSPSRFLIVCAGIAACLFLSVPTLAAASDPAAPIPVAAFFGPTDLSAATISPDGLHLAAISLTSRGKESQQCVVVLELRTRKLAASPICHQGGDVHMVRWVNSRRLVFDYRPASLSPEFSYSGLFAIDFDGKNYRQLVAADWRFQSESVGSHIKSRILTSEYRFSGTLSDGSDAVLVVQREWDHRGFVLERVTPWRLDTRTGELQHLVENIPEHVKYWLCDSTGRPRFAVALAGGKSSIYEGSGDGKSWTLFDSFPQFSAEGYELDTFGQDGELYVVALGGQDTKGLYRFDRSSHRIAPSRVVNLEGFDYEGMLHFDQITHRVIGIHYLSDAPGTVWLDQGMAAVQKKIDDQLPGMINRIDCSDCLAAPFLLVKASSDRQPELTLIYDRAQNALVQVGASRPQIAARAMGRRSFGHFSARDGLSIPIYVTRPAGAEGPTPAVVLVHGGPWVHGTSWPWDAEAQFLASRGYTVLQPAFRGSTGYGNALFRASWEQWGLTMQDDLADAANWAIGKGWVDPDRIAIAGASYGGYATLMGLIKNPELFRTGFEWVGISDIGLMFTSTQSDFSDDTLGHTLPELVGDPATHAAQFAATSPLKRAAELKQPVLLAYGGRDHRVPEEHGTAFRAAVENTNQQVEWVLYPEEGHGWVDTDTQLDFWGRVERFLGRHLAPRAKTASGP